MDDHGCGDATSILIVGDGHADSVISGECDFEIQYARRIRLGNHRLAVVRRHRPGVCEISALSQVGDDGLHRDDRSRIDRLAGRNDETC